MSDRTIKVTAVTPCFIGGARRRAGESFTIVREDYVDYDGVLRLPSCVEVDPAVANKRIATLEGKGLAAVIASSGGGATIKHEGKVIKSGRMAP